MDNKEQKHFLFLLFVSLGDERTASRTRKCVFVVCGSALCRLTSRILNCSENSNLARQNMVILIWRFLHREGYAKTGQNFMACFSPWFAAETDNRFGVSFTSCLKATSLPAQKRSRTPGFWAWIGSLVSDPHNRDSPSSRGQKAGNFNFFGAPPTRSSCCILSTMKNLYDSLTVTTIQNLYNGFAQKYLQIQLA